MGKVHLVDVVDIVDEATGLELICMGSLSAPHLGIPGAAHINYMNRIKVDY